MKKIILLLAGCLILSGCQKISTAGTSSADQTVISDTNDSIMEDSASSVALPSAVTQTPDASSRADSVPTEPQMDVRWDSVEPTVELLQKYDDILTPFAYQKSGELMTDEEIVAGFTTLYQSGHTVYYWYLNPDGLQSEVDMSAMKIVDEQGRDWRPAKRIATHGEMTALVESIFTNRFRMNALIGSDGNLFRSYDGRLYIYLNGGIGDPYQPQPETARVLAKTPDALLIEMDIGFNNVPTAKPRPTVFTLIHQGAFWVLDNWL